MTTVLKTTRPQKDGVGGTLVAFVRWLAGLDDMPGEPRPVVRKPEPRRASSRMKAPAPRAQPAAVKLAKPAAVKRAKQVPASASVADVVQSEEEREMERSLWAAAGEGGTFEQARGPAPVAAAKPPAEMLSSSPELIYVTLPSARAGSRRDSIHHGQRADLVRLEDLMAASVIYDLETTGLSRSNDHVIQIGAARVRDGRIVERFSRYVRPPTAIPYFITDLTGISNSHVRNAGDAISVLGEFSRWAGADLLVAHNGKNFDSGFIRAELDRASAPLRETSGFDTLHLARRTAPIGRKNGLGDLAHFYGVRGDGRLHEATTDVEVLFRVLGKLVEDAKRQGLTDYAGHTAWLSAQ